MAFTPDQQKLIQEMAAWLPPEKICDKCAAMGGVCHLLVNLIRGNALQQEDLKLSSALSFAADCTLNDSPDHIDIFDMLEKLNA